MMLSFRCQGQDWELPNINPEQLPSIRPSLFISHFFAIDSNKRKPASSNNKHFLTEAFKTLLERKLGFAQGGEEEHRALHKWKDDHYWTIGHGEPGDPFSTRVNPNSNPDTKMTSMGQNGNWDLRPEKQIECHYWRRDGYCKYREDECSYAHHETGTIARNPELKLKEYKFQPSRNMYPPPVKYAECFYWKQGKCKFTDDECLYAHYPIPNSSDRHETPPDRRSRYESPDTRQDDSIAQSSKQYECYFWRRDGYCKFTEEECQYAHHLTGKIKEGPYRPLNSRAIEVSEKLPEPKQLPPSPKRKATQHSHDAKPISNDYQMPPPSSIKLAELTLSSFYDMFCYNNPTARIEKPWDVVLPFYKKYVVENYGKDVANNHLISALGRTKVEIPTEVANKYIIQLKLESERAKKESSSTALTTDKANGNGTTVLKRIRSTDEDATAAPKRVKSEYDTAVVSRRGEVATRSIPQTPNKDTQVTSANGGQSPSQRSTRLYSPSMPHLEKELPSSNESSSLRTSSNQVAPADSLAARISKANTNHVSKDSAKTSATYGSEMARHLSTPVSPTRKSKHNRAESIIAAPNGNAVVTNGTHMPAPSKQGSSSTNPSFSIDKSTLPGLLPATNGKSSESRPLTSTDGVLQASPQTYQAPKETTAQIQDLYEALKSRSNGYLAPSGATHLTSCSVPLSSNTNTHTQQHVFANHEHDQERPGIGGAKPKDSLPVHLTNGTSLHNHNVYPYQEPSQEPMSAHVVRLEALLKGVLAELEIIKRIAR